MSDFRVDIRVRNNLLLSAIENSFCKTIAGVSEMGGPSLNVIYGYVNLKRSPLDSFGNWQPSALCICDVIGVLPDEVFTEAHYEALKTNRAQFVADMGDINRLIESKDPLTMLEEKESKELIWDALETLHPREKLVLQLRNVDDLTLAEIGKRLDVTGNRVMQIEGKALRKLRHPDRRKFFAGAA